MTRNEREAIAVRTAAFYAGASEVRLMQTNEYARIDGVITLPLSLRGSIIEIKGVESHFRIGTKTGTIDVAKLEHFDRCRAPRRVIGFDFLGDDFVWCSSFEAIARAYARNTGAVIEEIGAAYRSARDADRVWRIDVRAVCTPFPKRFYSNVRVVI